MIIYIVDTVPEVIETLQKYGIDPCVSEVAVKKITAESGAWWYEVIIEAEWETKIPAIEEQPKSLHIIPCINPGLSCCDHRLTGKKPADNVWRCEVWCRRWRGNRMKDRVFHACEPEYKVKESAEE